MGNSIHKVDEGLFICGVSALQPRSRLQALGIKCILNAAQAELYMQSHSFGGSPGRERLEDLPEHFEVLTIGAQDAEDCNLSAHFAKIADFIEAGRAKGGVVVHCAAGVSRASTSTISYLMLKEKWELNAALTRVHAVRTCVRPNAGFWRQLRDLEASLRGQGVVLRELPPGWQPPEQPGEAAGEEGRLPTEGRSTTELLQELDAEATRFDSFVTTHLTARLVPSEGVPPEDLARRLRSTRFGGVTWEGLMVHEASVAVRAGLVPSLDGKCFEALLSQLPGVHAVTVEGAA